jgi:hypothetical protein
MIGRQPKDKNGIPIEPFDVLKVFHFTGPRRKKYYMYKVAILWNDKLYGAHLNENPLKPGYPLWIHDSLEDTEIVQSLNWQKLE